MRPLVGASIAQRVLIAPEWSLDRDARLMQLRRESV
jgi:hypothetical protein